MTKSFLSSTILKFYLSVFKCETQFPLQPWRLVGIYTGKHLEGDTCISCCLFGKTLTNTLVFLADVAVRKLGLSERHCNTTGPKAKKIAFIYASFRT